MSLDYELDSLAPIVDWEDFNQFVFDWKQGEHVGLV